MSNENANQYRQYYQSKPRGGLVFKLFVSLLVLFICTGISIYSKSLETVFKVREVHINGSSIVMDVERQDPWMKQFVDFVNSKGGNITDLSLIKVDLNTLGKESYGYTSKEKKENRLVEIKTQNGDLIKLNETISVNIDSSDVAVCIKQNAGNYELIVKRNEETGNWERMNWWDSFVYELKNPWMF